MTSRVIIVIAAIGVSSAAVQTQNDDRPVVLRHARVTGHLESVSCSDAAALGIDNIEHSWASCRRDLGEMEPSSARGELQRR